MKNLLLFTFCISFSYIFAQKDNLKDALKQVQELKNNNKESTNSLELQPTEDKALLLFTVTDYKNVAEEGAILVISGVNHSFDMKGVTNIDGKFNMLIPKGKKYTVKVEKAGKVFNFDKPEDVIDIPALAGEISMEQNLSITVVTRYIRKFKVDNLYFDSNQYEIKQESKGPLDKLYETIIANPNMKVEIAGHTDNNGNEIGNMRISQLRANSVRDYFISKGLAANRIISKGYGATAPEATNDTEDGRKLNRRIEVRVITE